MDHYCTNHPTKKALSFCHICNNYYCKECLREGSEYYYCLSEKCLQEFYKDRNNIEASYITNPRFCPNCIKETSSESMGNLDLINFIGTTFTQIFREVCPICNSFIVEKRYIIFGITIKSYGYYKVIQLKKYRTDLAGSKESIFYSRKLLNQKPL